MKIFNDPATEEAMLEDKITGGVEIFILDETLKLCAESGGKYSIHLKKKDQSRASSSAFNSMK